MSQRISTLVDLSLYWNVKITDHGVDEICRANTQLKYLKLSGCKRLTDDSSISVARSCTAIEMLDMTRCPKISDRGIIQISSQLPNLHTLLLYASSGFGDQGVSSIFSSLTRLEILDLCGTGQLTDNGLKPCISTKHPRLRKLNLGWCPKLTDDSLVSIASGCENLEYVYLLGNPNMTMEGLTALSRGCSRICGLDVCGLRVADRSKAALLPLFPHLTSLAKLGQAPNYDDY